MELLLIWVVIGIIAAKVYRNKGRSYKMGFAAGFILGPLGLLLALLSGTDVAGKAKQIRREEEDEIRSGVSKRCEVCDEVIAAAARKCKHCGSET